MKCGGSGKRQMLSWLPDDSGYPGAVVCLNCSLGIQVRKGTVRQDISESGLEGLSGIVKVHNRPPREHQPSEHTTYKKCKHEGCENKIPDHAWGHIKAEGWFQQKNGTIWCPNHHPEWVAKWRRGRKKIQDS